MCLIRDRDGSNKRSEGALPSKDRQRIHGASSYKFLIWMYGEKRLKLYRDGRKPSRNPPLIRDETRLDNAIPLLDMCALVGLRERTERSLKGTILFACACACATES